MRRYAIRRDIDGKYFTYGGWTNFHRPASWCADINSAKLYETKSGIRSVISRAQEYVKRFNKTITGTYCIVTIQLKEVSEEEISI